MKHATDTVVLLMILAASSLPAKTIWQPNFAVRVMVAFDESRGFGFVPAYKSLPLPEYPLELRRAHVGGDVDFEFTVLKDGSITDVTLRGKFPQLRDAVAQAIKAWRFYPLAEASPQSGNTAKMRGKVRFDMPDDIEVSSSERREFGITYELDEKTGKRTY
jgi:TonB family protein